MRRGFQWMAWWYAAIAVGFFLLAAVYALKGDKPWLVGVRVVIGLGFGFLAYMEFTARKRKG